MIMTPEPRYDKHNRLVTRHVRVPQTPSKARMTLPDPVIAPSATDANRAALILEVKASVHGIMSADPDRYWYAPAKAYNTIDYYPTELLESLIPLLAKRDSVACGLTDNICRETLAGQMKIALNVYERIKHIPGMSLGRASFSARALNEYDDKYFPKLRGEAGNLQPEHYAVIIVAEALTCTLSRDERYEAADETDDPERPLNFVEGSNAHNNHRAIYKLAHEDMVELATRRAQDSERMYDIITRSGLRRAGDVEGVLDLMDNRPEDAARIKAILEAKSCTRVAQVETMLNGGTSPALLEGVL